MNRDTQGSISMKTDKSNRSELQMAGDFLKEEINKAQNFYMLKLSDFKFEKIIGSGASAEVYKSSYKEMDVAVKRLRFPTSAASTTESSAQASTLTKEF